MTFLGFFLRDVTLFPPKKTGEKTRSLEEAERIGKWSMNSML